MRHLQSVEWFQSHIASVDGPLVHFGEDLALDQPVLLASARRLGFAYLVVECRRISTEDDLIDAFGRDLGFPNYFGGNWNAVADCLRDLSWIPAKGYVLSLLDSDQLGLLPALALDAFTRTIETVIAEWRDERGEWNERHGPIPFHWVLSSNSKDASWLQTRTREPYCVHCSDGSVQVTLATAAIRGTEAFAAVEAQFRERRPAPSVIRYLAQRGVDRWTASYLLAAAIECPVRVARGHIEDSRLWS